MDAERWRRMKDLYQSAADRTPGDRGDFLLEACGTDHELRREIESLLDQRDKEGILDHPVRGLSEVSHPDAGQVSVLPLRHALSAPLWLYLLASLSILRLGLNCAAEFYGPEPAGWRLDHPATNRYVVTEIVPHSPAARAGIRSGDRILEMDGIAFTAPVERFAWRTAPGKSYMLRIERGGAEQDVAITFGSQPWRAHLATAHGVANLVTIVTALLAAAVGLFIAWSRPRDWVSLGFAWPMFSVLSLHMPDGIDYLWVSLPWPLMAALHVHLFVANVGIVPLLLAAILNFPRRLLVRPWYWLLLATPFAINQWFLVSGIWRQHLNPAAPGWTWLTGRIFSTLVAIYLIASLCALTWRYRRLHDLNERRRMRLLFAAIALGSARFLPDFTVGAAVLIGGAGNSYHASLLPVAFSFLQIPIPFLIGLAILRHQVFDIRILIRQGIRYAVARRLLLGVVPLCGAALVVDLLLHGDQPLWRLLTERGWWYIALAACALLAHWRRQTWMVALDRRFYREHYDAYRVLTGLVSEIRHCSDVQQLARRMVSQINAALHPRFTVLLLRKTGETRLTPCASAGDQACPEFGAAGRIMALLRAVQRPLDCSTSSGALSTLSPHDTGFLRRARIEWIFPVLTGNTEQEAILALGSKRSEEPYSHEDCRLLECLCDTFAVHLRSAAAARSTLLHDTLAGRYLLARCLGRGGMGTVYEALDTQLDRRVAVKLIRDDLTADPQTTARFVREAKNAAVFCHPNVVTIYDFGVAADGRAYLVMELLEGATLRQELRRESRLAAGRVVSILRNLCGALETAHDRGLIHRDLKPENVFLTRVADVEVAKLLDFGIAKSLIDSSGHTATVETANGLVLGTPGYIPPENLRGACPTVLWDVWALGVVAYEMLTGAFPFSPASGDWSIAPVPEAVGKGARWDHFFGRALAVDPALRPASAAEFLIEFERELLRTSASAGTHAAL